MEVILVDPVKFRKKNNFVYVKDLKNVEKR